MNGYFGRKTLYFSALIIFAPVLFLYSPVFAGRYDHTENLIPYGILNISDDCECVFSPMVHSPSKPFEKKYASIGGVIMPLIYFLYEKYPIYSENASRGENFDDNMSRYMPKILNISPKIAARAFMEHLASPSSFFYSGILSNLTFSWYIDFSIRSLLRYEKAPVPVSVLSSDLEFNDYLVYSRIEASEYSVYLIYSPLSPPDSNRAMYEKLLVYKKDDMRFSVFENSRQGGVSSKAALMVLFHDIGSVYSKFDRFDKFSRPVYGFSAAYDFLKLQIEKKIIKDENKLKTYRLYYFLSQARQTSLSDILKNIKTTVLEPLQVSYLNKLGEARPLSVDMGFKNQREQEQAVIKKFTLLNEKYKKMNLNLVPRREFDIVYKKVGISSN